MKKAFDCVDLIRSVLEGQEIVHFVSSLC